MQLRTVKKPKNKAFEFTEKEKNEHHSQRKNSINKEQSEKEALNDSNEVHKLN